MLFALCSTISSQQAPSLASRLVPNPSGKNGYEEYVYAADRVNTPLWKAYDNWLAYLSQTATDLNSNPPAMPDGITIQMSDLDVRRRVDNLFGSALNLVHEGNRKPVFDPRTEFTAETLLPELAVFKTVGRVISNRAHVDFSAGRATAATDALLDGLTFAWNLIGDSIIAGLVGISIEAIMLSEFSDHLSQLTPVETARIESACKAMLGRPFYASAFYAHERKTLTEQIDSFLSKPEVLTVDGPDALTKSAASAIGALSSVDKLALKASVVRELDKRFGASIARFSGPETAWIPKEIGDEPKPIVDDISVSNLTLAVTNSLVTKGMDRAIARSVGKARIQFRLLRLHARVINYRWQHNRLPSRLEDFADKDVAFDPIGGAPFHYDLIGEDYRLYSLGLPSLGKIELRYRSSGRPAPKTSNAPPIS